MHWTWLSLAEARSDIARAKGDLNATAAQAGGIAAMAWAWRMTALTSALVPFAAAAMGFQGSLRPRVGYLALLAFAPLLVTFLLTFPLTFVAAAQGVFGRQVTDRFAFGGSVYVYYGWRYAFQRRLRPWGALTQEERSERNPQRLAKYTSALLHGEQGRYWPRSGDR